MKNFNRYTVTVRDPKTLVVSCSTTVRTLADARSRAEAVCSACPNTEVVITLTKPTTTFRETYVSK